MKIKTILIALLLLAAVCTQAQGIKQYDNILLNSANDYRKAEPQVILASDYVYSTSIDKKDQNRENAISFIMKWMQGTADYSFVMDETMKQICGSDKDLLGVFVACTVKYALSKGKGVDRDELRFNTYLLLARYCENPANNFKPHGEIKKLIEAKNQNKLKEYLASKRK